MYNFQSRNWNLPTISRGRDTRNLVPPGHHGNRGALTISIPKRLGDSIMAKWANGEPFMRLKMEPRGTDLVLKPAAPTEFGRKFLLSSEGRDYRCFYDPSSHPWIEQIEPFASTETTANLTDDSLIIAVPPVDKRRFLAPLDYKQRKLPRHAHRRPTYVQAPAPVAHVIEPVHHEDKLYLVPVPFEKDAKFKTMLRFLRLEALEE